MRDRARSEAARTSVQVEGGERTAYRKVKRKRMRVWAGKRERESCRVQRVVHVHRAGSLANACLSTRTYVYIGGSAQKLRLFSTTRNMERRREGEKERREREKEIERGREREKEREREREGDRISSKTHGYR